MGEYYIKISYFSALLLTEQTQKIITIQQGQNEKQGMKRVTLLSDWKIKASGLQRQTYALYLAYRHPRTPWYAKAFAALVVVYAFSPVDLIPDFIPVIGYLDDLVLIPLGVYLAMKMIPGDVMQASLTAAAEQSSQNQPHYRFMLFVIIAI
jgi:uncharacterized membrane protein YkvA (DUF1232 family)